MAGAVWFTHKTKQRKNGLTRIWTWVFGFKVRSDNRYTIRPLRPVQETMSTQLFLTRSSSSRFLFLRCFWEKEVKTVLWTESFYEYNLLMKKNQSSNPDEDGCLPCTEDIPMTTQRKVTEGFFDWRNRRKEKKREKWFASGERSDLRFSFLYFLFSMSRRESSRYKRTFLVG